MPPARRKSAPRLDAPPLPVDPLTTGKRAASAIGTRAMLDAMRSDPLPGSTGSGADVSLKHKARIVDWHSAVAQVSGTLVVAHGAKGISAEAARAVVKQLRLTADDMERRLLST